MDQGNRAGLPARRTYVGRHRRLEPTAADAELTNPSFRSARRWLSQPHIVWPTHDDLERAEHSHTVLLQRVLGGLRRL